MRSLLPIASAALALLLLPVPLRGADETSGEKPAAPAAPTPIPAADVPARGQEVVTELHKLRALVDADARMTEMSGQLPRLRAQVAELSEETVAETIEDMSAQEVEDVSRRWRRLQQQLTDWNRIVAARSQALQQAIERAELLAETWRVTAEGLGRDGVPRALLDEITAVRAAIDDVSKTLRTARDATLSLLSEIATLQVRVVSRLAEVDAATERLRRQLLTRDAPPLWAAWRDPDRFEWSGFDWRRPGRRLREFIADEPDRLVGYGFMLMVALGVAYGARTHVGRWPLEVQQLPAVQRLVERPISASVLLTAVIALVPAANDPLIASELAALVVLLPLRHFLAAQPDRRLTTLVALMCVVFALSFLRQAMPSLTPAARLVLLVEGLVIAAWITVFLRPFTAVKTGAQPWEGRATRLGRGLFVVLLAATIANIAGNVILASLLTRGAIGAGLLAVGLWAGHFIAEGMVDAILQSQTVLRVRAIALRAVSIRRRVPRVLAVVAFLAWVAGTLQFFGVLGPTLEALGDLLAARLEVGQLSLSAGDVLAFALTVVLAVFLSRAARALLEDDVLPRFDLPRGVPNAISAAAGYTILLVGFLFSVSAAGLDLSRVTVLAGAFGVGIGFGLQNVVNNFVSGLILLFERPLRIGDVVELSGVVGSVRRIGIRSSTIETFDGAEVIVPNGTLIAERLTNWTLADQRRIEIPLSVAMVEDPENLLALLRDVAVAHPDVRRQPPPEAQVAALGPGRLDVVLRAWTRYQRAAPVRSDLLVAVHAALHTAGIEMPVPQQELRVRPADSATARGEQRPPVAVVHPRKERP